MSVDLEEVRRYLVKALSKYYDHPDYEDGFQEGMIRAWKDVEEGNTSFLHVAHRAKQWAANFIRDNAVGRRHATGSPRLTNEGRRDPQGEKTRAKITQYIDEYANLHGESPTSTQISQGTGLSLSVVGYQRKNLREGKGFNHAIYTEKYGEQRIDYKSHQASPITSDNQDYIFSFNKISFEDTVVDNLDFMRLLEAVDGEHRKVLYWHYVIGYTAKEIAEMVGLAGGTTSGTRRIKFAHDAVLEVLHPEKYEAVCRNGHTRTPENTTVYSSRGGWRKICQDCGTIVRKRQAARRKSTKGKILKTHCKNNHEIRGFKTGRRYCKICNKLSQFPGMTVDQIPEDSKLWNWDKR